jgi:hypothetical protein
LLTLQAEHCEVGLSPHLHNAVKSEGAHSSIRVHLDQVLLAVPAVRWRLTIGNGTRRQELFELDDPTLVLNRVIQDLITDHLKADGDLTSW